MLFSKPESLYMPSLVAFANTHKHSEVLSTLSICQRHWQVIAIRYTATTRKWDLEQKPLLSMRLMTSPQPFWVTQRKRNCCLGSTKQTTQHSLGSWNLSCCVHRGKIECVALRGRRRRRCSGKRGTQNERPSLWETVVLPHWEGEREKTLGVWARELFMKVFEF